jgi:hypothetical protein
METAKLTNLSVDFRPVRIKFAVFCRFLPFFAVFGNQTFIYYAQSWLRLKQTVKVTTQ